MSDRPAKESQPPPDYRIRMTTIRTARSMMPALSSMPPAWVAECQRCSGRNHRLGRQSGSGARYGNDGRTPAATKDEVSH